MIVEVITVLKAELADEFIMEAWLKCTRRNWCDPLLSWVPWLKCAQCGPYVVTLFTYREIYIWMIHGIRNSVFSSRNNGRHLSVSRDLERCLCFWCSFVYLWILALHTKFHYTLSCGSFMSHCSLSREIVSLRMWFWSFWWCQKLFYAHDIDYDKTYTNIKTTCIVIRLGYVFQM